MEFFHLLYQRLSLVVKVTSSPSARKRRRLDGNDPGFDVYFEMRRVKWEFLNEELWMVYLRKMKRKEDI